MLSFDDAPQRTLFWALCLLISKGENLNREDIVMDEEKDWGEFGFGLPHEFTSEGIEFDFVTEKEILGIVKKQCPVLIWHKRLHEDDNGWSC